MKHLLSLLIPMFIASGPVSGADAWRSPKGDKEVMLEKGASPAGDIDKLAVNGTDLTILANSNIRRENHGYGWMESAEATWIDDRFLVFEDESGLAIIDAETNQLLLNQVLTGYSESPDGQAWAAIRNRNLPGNQDALTGTEEDTLWFLDPGLLAENSGSADADHPFAHVPSVQIGGIALAPPEWSKDGTSLTVTLFSNGNILQETYNVASRKRTGSVAVKNPGLSRDQLLSLGFLPEVKNALDQGASTGAGNEGPNGDSPRRNRQGGASDPAAPDDAAERPLTSKMALWSAIAVVSLAAIAFLIKRGGKA